MEPPVVSIVIPVYNAGRHLAGSIGSMIEQTFPHWEMICVDDGSTDGSSQVLDWFASIEPRIQVIHQTNSGIVDALNRGCALARGGYLCRMDADDIATPNRLEVQSAWLNAHPKVVALGASILEMDEDGAPLGVQRLALEHDAIVARLMARQPGLFHPTTMIRTDAFREANGYRKEYEWIEDHDLWLRLGLRGELRNLEDVLLCYRQHASSVCWQRRARQNQLMQTLMREAFEERGLPYEPTLEQDIQRTQVNPGKWARKAIRGGYMGTALKHLGHMWREQGPTVYALRMTAEVALRSVPACAFQALRDHRLSVPSLDEWQTRIQRAGLSFHS